MHSLTSRQLRSLSGVRPSTRPHSTPCSASFSGRLGPASSPVDQGYAVIDVGGLQTYVEVGHAVIASKESLQNVGIGSTLRFEKVVALKKGNELRQGKPYLNAIVEGRLEDEFAGPSKRDQQISRVMITRIAAVDEIAAADEGDAVPAPASTSTVPAAQLSQSF